MVILTRSDIMLLSAVKNLLNLFFYGLGVFYTLIHLAKIGKIGKKINRYYNKRNLKRKLIHNLLKEMDSPGKTNSKSKNVFLCLFVRNSMCYFSVMNYSQAMASNPVRKMWFNNAKSANYHMVTLEQRYADILGYDIEQPVSDNSTNVVELSNYAATCSSEEEKYSHIPNWRMRMFDQI